MLLSSAFYFLLFSVFYTTHSMDLSKIEKGNLQSEIKKERVLCEEDLNHLSDIKFSHKPVAVQRSVPLLRLSPKDDRESLSNPKTPPQNIKVVIKIHTPDLIPVRSPLMRTNASPFRSKTPPPSNFQDANEDLLKPKTPPLHRLRTPSPLNPRMFESSNK